MTTPVKYRPQRNNLNGEKEPIPTFQGLWVPPNLPLPKLPVSSPPIRGKFHCGFCKQNGEPLQNFTSHNLRDAQGRVSCPILREHVCEFCGETGDYAHTKSYCELARTLSHLSVELHLKKESMTNKGELRKTHFSAAGRRFS